MYKAQAQNTIRLNIEREILTNERHEHFGNSLIIKQNSIMYKLLKGMRQFRAFLPAEGEV